MAGSFLRAGAFSLLLICLPAVAAGTAEDTDVRPRPVRAVEVLLDEAPQPVTQPNIIARLLESETLSTRSMLVPLRLNAPMPEGTHVRVAVQFPGRGGALALGSGWGLVLDLDPMDAADVDARGLEGAFDRVTSFFSSTDKQLHFLASSTLVLSAKLLTGDTRWGVVAALTAGLGKEVIWDYLLQRGDPAAGDMLANLMGVGFVCLAFYLADLLVP